MKPNEFFGGRAMSERGVGYLKIRATSTGGALPVEGAVVRINEYTPQGNGNVLYSLRTNEGGLTETVSLGAPPAAESMMPGAARPYSIYNVTVTKDGYYPVESVAVPIFERIVAVQPINMIPITEEESIAGAEDGVMIYETPDTESLQPGGLTREDIGSENGGVSGRASAGGMR